MLFGMAEASAATPTPQQLEQFKKLPKAQQEALAKQYGIDLSTLNKKTKKGSDASNVDEISVFPRKEEALSEEDKLEEKFKPKVQELKPFGYDLFAGEPMSFMPSEISAIPDSYIVGRGDEFQINLYGKENQLYDVEVDREGRLAIPDLSPVLVAGLSFSEVKELITAKISQEIIGVKAFVSLGRLRSMRVMVLGEVFKPGAYTVSSLSSLSHALFIAGGISEIGSLRNIQLKRAGQTITTLDYYDLLIHGDNRNDVMLKPGDVVFVPAVGKQVSISGLVKRPAIFELKQNETAEDLIKMAGGFKAEAFPQKTIVERYSNNSFKTVLTLDFTQKPLDYSPQDGDAVNVQASSKELENAVTLMGAVSHPGNYAWQKGDKISTLISSLKTDVLPIADFDYSLIIREKNIRGEIEVLQFSLVDVLSHVDKDLILQPRDVVIVFSRFEEKVDEKRVLSKMAFTEDEIALQDKVELWQEYENRKFQEYIGIFEEKEELKEKDVDSLTQLLKGEKEELKEEEYSLFSRRALLKPVILKLQQQASSGDEAQLLAINGKVRYPGVYPLVKNAHFAKALAAAGGLLESAYLEKAEVTRLSQDSAEKVEHITFNIESALQNQNDQKYQLKSKDSINIFAVPNWQEEVSVQLIGEVQFPGTYSIKRGETLESVLARAGGFTEFSAPEGAIFTRESIRVKERAQLKKLSDDLRREIASRSFQNSVTDSSLSYDDTNKLLDDLAKVEALGRLVIDVNDIYNGSQTLELENGDALYIPAVQNTVSVIGEVNLATSHLFNKEMTLEAYIAASGGYKQRADEERIYIIKANGSVQLPNESSWFSVNSGTYLAPGDTIVVPLDAEHMDKLTLWSTATQIIYQLGLAAAAISAL
ncbi:polysaccharide biosynthesis protein [Pseudoalteromonas tunicata]|uniref:Polysaccharide biosynthesis/export protein n=2 Tax=Pseudoalteromonas tunicata TaxID=314281 RepID=A4C8G5_9GAMM|nr:SLBB domain-containing protein [Pseudoalteromonas tunicata]AXT32755.1 polysaccharide biosynthesis protein [Pseudoalteromonas tunicata]EAR28880.1 polysaccharide biosynthesis/export protein [Pseudoalteromonas tunicata D2]